MDWLDVSGEVRARTEFYQRYFNQLPKKLLLGKQQIAALNEWAKRAGFKSIPKIEGKRTEYNGMQIYQVDDENYVGVNA